MQLPDAETLCLDLTRQLRPHVTPDTGMVGIHTGGAWLAERLHQQLGFVVPLGMLDISFYRDDYRKAGLHKSVRAAMNELFDYGRPESIRLAALVDRGERQLPICAQYVGTSLTVPTGSMLRLDRDASGRLALRLDT